MKQETPAVRSESPGFSRGEEVNVEYFTVPDPDHPDQIRRLRS